MTNEPTVEQYQAMWVDVNRYLTPSQTTLSDGSDLLDRLASKHGLDIPSWDKGDPIDPNMTGDGDESD